jgi:hypothetical protein
VLTDKVEMERACIDENISHFSQSEGTPPMTDPQLDNIWYLAGTVEADLILAGTYQPPMDLDYYTKLFLKELHMPDNVRNNPMPHFEISPQSNQELWCKQKEAISSDPEGLSYSHYKAGALDDDINAFAAGLRDFPYRFGFSPMHCGSQSPTLKF